MVNLALVQEGYKFIPKFWIELLLVGVTLPEHLFGGFNLRGVKPMDPDLIRDVRNLLLDML